MVAGVPVVLVQLRTGVELQAAAKTVIRVEIGVLPVLFERKMAMELALARIAVGVVVHG